MKTMSVLFLLILGSFIAGAAVNLYFGWTYGALVNALQGSFWAVCVFISERAKEVE